MNASSMSYYYKAGTRFECMKKGFGAGTHIEIKKKLPSESLQQIKYVGKIYENNFKGQHINNLKQLRKVCSQKKSSKEIEVLLKKIFSKKGGGIDKRAYNSTVLYLVKIGVRHIPNCSKI